MNTNEIKVILSRYKVPRILERVDEKNFHLYGESDYMRHSIDPDTREIIMIDYEGGPLIMVGNILSEFGMHKTELVQISPASVEGKSNCYLLTTKESEPS